MWLRSMAKWFGKQAVLYIHSHPHFRHEDVPLKKKLRSTEDKPTYHNYYHTPLWDNNGKKYRMNREALLIAFKLQIT